MITPEKLKETVLSSKKLPLSIVCSFSGRKASLNINLLSLGTMTNSALHDSVCLVSVLYTSEYSPKMEILVFLYQKYWYFYIRDVSDRPNPKTC